MQGGGRGGAESPPPLEFTKLNIADITGNMKKIVIFHICDGVFSYLRLDPPPLHPGKNFLDPRLVSPRFNFTEISLNFNIAQDLCKSNAHMIYYPRFSLIKNRFNIAQDICKSNAPRIYFPRFSPTETRFNIAQDVCKSNAPRINRHAQLMTDAG